MSLNPSIENEIRERRRDLNTPALLPPYQARVLSERDELAERLMKLNTFIGGNIYMTLAEAERMRLAKQANIMKDYLDILNERIAAF